MEQRMLDKLREEGAIRSLGASEEGVAVSLHYVPALDEPARDRRRHLLENKLCEAAEAVERVGGSWDPSSLSVSGQTVEAVLPVAHYDRLIEILWQQRVRVDPLVEVQVIQPI